MKIIDILLPVIFTLGFELMIVLCLFKHYSITHQYIGLAWCLWLVVLSLLFGPFWFNPLSFEASKVCEDYTKWQIWMNETGGTPAQSWEAWFKEETEYIKHMSVSWRIFFDSLTKLTLGSGRHWYVGSIFFCQS